MIRISYLKGSYGPRKTGKCPEFEILFPAMKKPRISVLSRENSLVTGKFDFTRSVSHIKFLWLKWKFLLVVHFNENHKLSEFPPGSSGDKGSPFPLSQSKGQNWQMGTRHYFANAHRAEMLQQQTTLLTSHITVISESSPNQLLQLLKHNIAFLTSFDVNEPALWIFIASYREHRGFVKNMQLIEV